MSGRATLATARLRLATAATRISAARTRPARLGLLDSMQRPTYPSMTAVTRRIGPLLRGLSADGRGAQAGGGAAHREGPAGRLASAAAAALARRAPRQRLGGRCRRRHRPLRHRDRRQGAAFASSTSPSAQAGFGLEDIRLLVCTHSHTDHYGLAAPIVEEAGCELWMHPAWEHVRLLADDPAAALEQRLEVARQSGVPVAGLERYRESRKGDDDNGIDAIVEPDRDLLPGVEVETDLGTWQVHETPGHAPVARRPAPARAQADDLRRPPARSHGALLRPRPQPRPGRRVPRQPRRGRAARRGPLPARARPPLP